MKLHLPHKLRTALIASLGAITTLGTTLSSGTIAAGAASAIFASQAWAADYTVTVESDSADLTTETDGMPEGEATLGEEDTVIKEGAGTLTVTDYTTLQNAGEVKVSEGVLEVTYASVWGEATQGKGFTTGDVTVEAGATLLLTGTDALGYESGDATEQVNSITLQGTPAVTEGETLSDAVLATMQMAGKITLSTNLLLSGDTLVESTTDTEGNKNGYLESFGGTITATGTNNSITAKLTTAEALTINGTGSLTLGEVVNTAGLVIEADTTIATYSTSSTGSIKVKDETTLTISDSTTIYKDGSLALLGVLKAVEATDKYTGTVVFTNKATNGGEMAATTTEIKGNFLFQRGLSINSYDNSTSGIDHTVKVLAGGSLTAQNAEGTRQNMEFLSNQQLTIAGGSVTAGGLLIGHSSEGTFSGTLLLESGSLSVDYISLQNNNTSSGMGSLFKMTGGTLSILSNPWQGGGSLRITDDDTEVQLLGGVINTTGNTMGSGEGAWLNVRENTKITLGAVEFAGDRDITLANGNAYFTSTVTNNVSATLKLNSNTLVVESLSGLDQLETVAPEATENGYGTSTYWLVKKGDNGNVLSLAQAQVWLGGTEANGGTATALTVADGSATFTATGTIYHVNSGEVDYSDAKDATSITLNGGQLNVAGGDASTKGTVVTQDIYVAAKSTISGGATGETTSTNQYHAGITGSITGVADLVIDSAATTPTGGSHGNFFALAGTVNLGSEADLIIAEGGIVRLGSYDTEQYQVATDITARSIIVEKNATLELYRAGAVFGATEENPTVATTGLTLTDGRLHMQNIYGSSSGGGTLAFGTLTVNGTASSITSASYGGNVSFTSLTGTGALSVSGGSTTIASVSDYSGTLSLSGGSLALNGGTYTSALTVSGGSLTINGMTLGKGGTMTLNAAPTLTNLTLNGGLIDFGKINLSGSIVLTGAEDSTLKGDSMNGSTLSAAITGTTSGNLILHGANASGGKLLVTSDIGHTGDLTLQGLVDVQSGANIHNAGNVEVTSGTVNVLAGATFSTQQLTVSGGTLTASAALTATNGTSISSGAELVLNAGASSLGAVTNAGALTVNANTGVTTLTGNGTLNVAAGKTLTINSASSYTGDNFWTLLAKGTGAGMVALNTNGANLEINTNAGGNKQRQLGGHYEIQGSLLVNNSGYTQSVTIGSGSSLTITGEAQFTSKQSLVVNNGGALTVGGVLGLGHTQWSDDHYYGNLTIGTAPQAGTDAQTADTSSVTIGGLTFNNTNETTNNQNYLKLYSGTLTILDNGETAGSIKAEATHNSEFREGNATLELLGGTIKTATSSTEEGATAKGWSTGSGVQVTLGGVTVDTSAGGTITLGTSEQELTFAGTVSIEAGSSLVLNASSFSSTHLDNFEHEAYGNATSNGFGEEITYTLITLGKDAALTINGSENYSDFYLDADADAGVTGHKVTYTANTDTEVGGGVYTFTQVGSIYRVVEANNKEVAYSTVTQAAEDAGIDATHISLEVEGATLTVASDENVSLEILVAADSTISAGAKAVLAGGINADVLGGGNLTIKSAGETSSWDGHGDGVSLDSNIDLGEHSLIISEGVVRMGNLTSDTTAHALKAKDVVVNSGATLELFRDGGDINAGLKLDGGTLHIQVIGTNGSKTLNFNELNVSKDGAVVTNKWGGSLSFTSLEGSGSLSLSGDQRDYSVTIGKADNYSGDLTIGKKTAVVINGGTLSGDVTVSGSGSSSKIDLNSGTTATGTLKVVDGSTSKVTITKQGDDYAVSNVSVSGSGITGHDSTTVSLKDASVEISQDYALNGVKLEDCHFSVNAALKMGETSSVSVANSELAIGSLGTLEGSVMSFDNVSGALTLGVVDNGGLATVTPASGDNSVVTFTTAQLAGTISVGSTGSFTLDIAATDLTNQVGKGGEIVIVLSGLSIETENVQTLSALDGGSDDSLSSTIGGISFSTGSTLAGAGYSVSSAVSEAVGSDGGNRVVITLNYQAIPEPTTATLSLLALAALATRRRRK